MDGGRRRPDRVGLGVEWSRLVISGSQISCQDRYRAWGFGRRDWWFDLEVAATTEVGVGL